MTAGDAVRFGLNREFPPPVFSPEALRPSKQVIRKHPR